MKGVWGISAAFIALWCSNVFAASYPTEDALRTAIQSVSHFAEAEGLEVEILDAQKEGVTRPLMAAGLSLTKGTCLLFYNTLPLRELKGFFEGIPERELPLWLNAIAVHELTHCIEQREAYIHERYDRVLPPGYDHGVFTLRSYLAVVKSGVVEKWSEALADIAAVLYFRQVVPAEWTRYAKQFAAMRESLGHRFPAHDTSGWLYKLIAANGDKAANQSLFEAAFELRLQFEPD